jgi:hypothetical protein
MNPVQTPLKQSLPVWQSLPTSQRPHRLPPQSMPTSSPFLKPSLQVASRQMPS